MYNVSAQLQMQAPTNSQVASVINKINRQFQGAAVDIRIKANQRQLGQVASGVKEIDKTAKKATGQVNKLGQALRDSFRRFGSVALVTGGILSLTRSLKEAVSEAISFERELIRISQVSGTSTKDLSGLANEVTRLSTTFGTSAQDILETSRVLSQAGFSAREAKKALDILTQTTLAPTFDSIQDTTEGAIALLNQFGTEAQKTGDRIDFLEKSLNAINEVSKKYAVESSDLIAAIRRTGGVFESSGGSLNELIALFTSVRATTRESAETIATGFRTIFTRIQRTETIESLKELGISLQDAEGRFVGPLEAIDRLSTGLRSLDPKDFRFNQIVEDLGGFRQIGKVIPLIKQFKTTTDALATAQNSQNSIVNDAAQAQESLQVRINQLREEFGALTREIVDSEGFRFLANTAIDFSKALIEVTKSLKPLIPLIVALGAVKIGKGFASLTGSAVSGLTGFNTGGRVPGVGSEDKVPALLTPGEYVLRKQAVQSIGLGKLQKLNEKGIKGFNKGGPVGVQRFQAGGSVSSGSAASSLLLLTGGAVALVATIADLDDETQNYISTLTTTTAIYYTIGNALLNNLMPAIQGLIGRFSAQASVQQQETASKQASIAAERQEAVASEAAAIADRTQTIASETAASALGQLTTAALLAAETLGGTGGGGILGNVDDVGLAPNDAINRSGRVVGSGNLGDISNVGLQPLPKAGRTGSFIRPKKSTKALAGFRKGLSSNIGAMTVLQGALIGFSVSAGIAAAEIQKLNSSIAESVEAFNRAVSDLERGGDGFSARQNADIANQKILQDFSELRRKESISATVGAGAGALGGALTGGKVGAGLGAALGSVVPVLGTAVGAAVGGAIGSIGGGIAGSVAGRKAGEAASGTPDLSNTEQSLSEYTKIILDATEASSQYRDSLQKASETLTKGESFNFDQLVDAREKLTQVSLTELNSVKNSAQAQLSLAKQNGATETEIKNLEQRAAQAQESIDQWNSGLEQSTAAILDNVSARITESVSAGDTVGFDRIIKDFQSISDSLDPEVAQAYTREIQEQTAAVLENKQAQVIQAEALLVSARAAQELSAAVDAATDISRVSTVIGQAASRALGRTSGPTFNTQSATQTGSLTAFDQELNRVASGLGPSVKSIINSQKATARNLQAIDVDFFRQFNQANVGELSRDDVNKIVANSFSGAGPEFVKVLQNTVQQRFTEGELSGDLDFESLVKGVREDINKTFGAANEEYIKAIAQAKDDFYKVASELNAAFAEAERNISSIRLQGVETRGKRLEQFRAIQGEDFTSGDVRNIGLSRSRENLRLSNRVVSQDPRLQGTSARPNVGVGVGAIRQQFENLRRIRGVQAQDRVAADQGDTDAGLRVEQQQNAIDGIIQNFNEAADQTALLTQSIKEYETVLDQEKQKREAVQSSLENFAFATNQGRQEIQRNFAAVNTVLASGSLESIPDQLRQPTLQILKQFEQVPIIAADNISKQQFSNLEQTFGLKRSDIEERGGLTGDQITKILSAQTAVRSGVLSPQGARAIFNEDQKTTREAQAFRQVTAEFARITEAERTARQALIANEQATQQQVLDARVAAEQDLINSINQIVNSSQQVSQTINQDLASTRQELSRVTGILKDIQSITVDGEVTLDGDIKLSEEGQQALLTEIRNVLKGQGVSNPTGRDLRQQATQTSQF